MGFFFVLMLKSACYTLGFYLFYRLLMNRDTFYRFNREALRLMFCLSFLLPCVTIPVLQTSLPEKMIGTVEVSMGYVMGIAEEPTTDTQFNWLSLLLIIYGAGVIFFAARAIISYICLAWMLHRGHHAKLSQYGIQGDDDIHLIVHHDKMSPFSWMNYIVISEQDLAENGAAAIAHEMGHIHFGHTLDLICTEIFVIFQWFNPAIWLMRRELQTIHEYQADEEVLNQGIDARQYQLLLIEKATGTRLQSITCSLHQSSIKKRITMMLKKKSNPWAKAKVLFVLPVAIGGIALFSCNESSVISSEISECKVSEFFGTDQENATKSYQHRILINRESRILYDSDYITRAELAARLKQDNVNANTVINIEVDKETPMATLSEVKNTLREAGINKVVYSTHSSSEKISETFSSAAEESKGSIFTVCEQMPEFPGGEAALMEYLKKSLQYPQECAENDIQGRVTLSFIIETDGSISSIEEIKSPNPLLTAEAKRIISIMPKWEPGSQRGHKVRVKYVLPITFRLK